jgi:hypothetical protein
VVGRAREEEEEEKEGGKVTLRGVRRDEEV